MEDEAFTKKKQQMEQLGLFYDEHTGKFFKKDAIIRQRQHESSVSHPPPSIQSRLANKKSKLESPFPCTFQHALFQLQTGYSKTELNFKKNSTSNNWWVGIISSLQPRPTDEDLFHPKVRRANYTLPLRYTSSSF